MIRILSPGRNSRGPRAIEAAALRNWQCCPRAKARPGGDDRVSAKPPCVDQAGTPVGDALDAAGALS
jgi:hypothetical protein